MNRILAGLMTCVAALLVGACGGGGYSLGSSAAAPTDVVVAAGDSSATVSWTMAPGVDYWIFLAPTDSINTSNWTSFLGARSVIRATSPQLVTQLSNGTTYAFTVNARVGNGPGGPGTPSQAIIPRIAGGVWVPATPLGTADLLGAAFGVIGTTTISPVSSFLAVGKGGAIYTSADGKSFAPQQSTVSADLRCAVFGGTYLAAGANGTVVSSADAITWAAKTSGTSAALNGLTTNGAGTYVAVGAGGAIVTSGDSGATWTLANSGTTKDLYAVTYGLSGSANAFVAVGSGGTMVASIDGVTWTPAASASTSADLRGITYASVLTLVSGAVTSAPVWVAVGSGGVILTSADAVTWSAPASGTGASLNAITYNTRFVAVGNGGTVLTSDDAGVSWQAQNSRSSANLAAITHNPYGYLAVGAAGANLTAF